MSHKGTIQEWLDDARERLKHATPGTSWYIANQKAIHEYEQLLERMEKPDREPGEDRTMP